VHETASARPGWGRTRGRSRTPFTPGGPAAVGRNIEQARIRPRPDDRVLVLRSAWRQGGGTANSKLIVRDARHPVPKRLSSTPNSSQFWPLTRVARRKALSRRFAGVEAAGRIGVDDIEAAFEVNMAGWFSAKPGAGRIRANGMLSSTPG